MNDTTYDWPGDGAQDTENAQHVREPPVLGASANERVAVWAIYQELQGRAVCLRCLEGVCRCPVRWWASCSFIQQAKH